MSERRAGLTPRGLLLLARLAGERWLLVNGPEHAAAIAFNALLSLAPLVLLMLTAVSRLLGSETAQAQLLTAVEMVAGEGAVGPAHTVLGMIVRARAGLLTTVLGVLIMVNFSSAVFAQLRSTLNRIWDVPPRAGLRCALYERLVSLVFVPAAVLAGLALMVAGLLSGAIGPILAQVLPRGSWLWGAGQGMIPFVLLAVLLAILYRQGPGTRVTWGDVWIGATLTAWLFTVGNYLLGAFIGRSLVVSFYGAAGALVVILLWVFYSAHLLLYGACFTHVYAERFGSRSRKP